MYAQIIVPHKQSASYMNRPLNACLQLHLVHKRARQFLHPWVSVAREHVQGLHQRRSRLIWTVDCVRAGSVCQQREMAHALQRALGPHLKEGGWCPTIFEGSLVATQQRRRLYVLNNWLTKRCKNIKYIKRPKCPVAGLAATSSCTRFAVKRLLPPHRNRHFWMIINFHLIPMRTLCVPRLLLGQYSNALRIRFGS